MTDKTKHQWAATGVSSYPLTHPIVGQGRFFAAFRSFIHLVDDEAEKFAHVFAVIGSMYDPAGDARLCIAKQHKTVLISDGLGETSVDPAMAALSRARQEGVVIQLLAPQEIVPNWTGDARLRDAETGVEREFTSTPVTKAAYLAALAERTHDIERSAHRRGLRFVQLSTEQPIDDMVLRTLRRLGLLS